MSAWQPPLSPAACHEPPILHARMRVAAEDFRVEELPAFAASGSGEHLLLTIEKTGLNSGWVAQQLARWAGVQELAVGYAGRKDRHAVTVQRYSLHLPKRIAPPLETLDIAGLRVLDSQWHARKLQRGALAGNRFTLVLRSVVGEPAAIETRLAQIATHGFANYFGEQRFGRDGGNLDAALSMFAGRRVGREQRSMLLSTARSALFNAVLDARVRAGTWDRGLQGEVWMLAGSHSVFGPEPIDESLIERCTRADIHPTGPLWGDGALRTTDAALACEQAALQGAEAICAGLARAGLKQERRALRAFAGDLHWRWLDADSLELGFELPPGSYATSLLHALGECESDVT